ncbi:MAG TPA: helix-turn-helix transcriptional regulator [Solirubrobacterales bacterium]|nr:helix-turn-helix transcriptional regulator [Solirubrobacterales bacterium]
MNDQAGSINRVKELLESSGKSRLDLALALGVSEDTARRLERPGELIPSKYIGPMVAFFDVTADHLLGLDQEAGVTA